jgi:hypothetical protein
LPMWNPFAPGSSSPGASSSGNAEAGQPASAAAPSAAAPPATSTALRAQASPSPRSAPLLPKKAGSVTSPRKPTSTSKIRHE